MVRGRRTAPVFCRCGWMDYECTVGMLCWWYSLIVCPPRPCRLLDWFVDLPEGLTVLPESTSEVSQSGPHDGFVRNIVCPVC
jgi:hypothetical protein